MNIAEFNQKVQEHIDNDEQYEIEWLISDVLNEGGADSVQLIEALTSFGLTELIDSVYEKVIELKMRQMAESPELALRMANVGQQMALTELMNLVEGWRKAGLDEDQIRNVVTKAVSGEESMFISTIIPEGDRDEYDEDDGAHINEMKELAAQLGIPILTDQDALDLIFPV